MKIETIGHLDSIDAQKANDPVARTETHLFGLAWARHNLVAGVLEPSQLNR